jgi:Ca-activated chloride channel family protein
MSYPIPSKTWQRVSILTLLLLIPTVGIAVLNQSLTKAIPTNSTIRRSYCTSSEFPSEFTCHIY